MLYFFDNIVKENTPTDKKIIFNRSLSGILKLTFIAYLVEFNQDEEIIKLAKSINWKSIIDIYKNGCKELRSQFFIPAAIDGLNVKNLDTAFYILAIQTTEYSLFHNLYLILKDHVSSNKSPDTLDDAITRNLVPMIKQYLSSYYFQLELIRITNNAGKPIETNTADKIKELTNLSKAFAKGNNFDPREIPVFKLILQEYNKILQTGLKKSYKSIAHYLGKTELGLSTKEEQYRFYKRFMAYKNNTQR